MKTGVSATKTSPGFKYSRTEAELDFVLYCTLLILLWFQAWTSMGIGWVPLGSPPCPMLCKILIVIFSFENTHWIKVIQMQPTLCSHYIQCFAKIFTVIVLRFLVLEIKDTRPTIPKMLDKDSCVLSIREVICRLIFLNREMAILSTKCAPKYA